MEAPGLPTCEVITGCGFKMPELPEFAMQPQQTNIPGLIWPDSYLNLHNAGVDRGTEVDLNKRGKFMFCACLCSGAQSCLTLSPWTTACQVPVSMEFPRQESCKWVIISFSRGSPDPGVFCISRWILYHWAIREASIAVIYEGFILLPQRTLYILTFHS